MAAGEQLWHPDIEMLDPPDFPDADRYVGEAAVRKQIESILELGWHGQFRVQEYLDVGDEVVVIWEMTGRTPYGGGFPIDVSLVHVWLFKGGKLRRVRQYRTGDEALEAAGLRE